MIHSAQAGPKLSIAINGNGVASAQVLFIQYY